MAHLRTRQHNDKKRNGDWKPFNAGKKKGKKKTQPNGKRVHVNRYANGAG